MELPLYENQLEPVLPLFLLAWRVDQNTVKVGAWVDFACCLSLLVAELVLDQFQHIEVEHIIALVLAVGHDGGVLTHLLPQIPLEDACGFSNIGFICGRR